MDQESEDPRCQIREQVLVHLLRLREAGALRLKDRNQVLSFPQGTCILALPHPRAPCQLTGAGMNETTNGGKQEGIDGWQSWDWPAWEEDEPS